LEQGVREGGKPAVVRKKEKRGEGEKIDMSSLISYMGDNEQIYSVHRQMRKDDIKTLKQKGKMKWSKYQQGL